MDEGVVAALQRVTYHPPGAFQDALARVTAEADVEVSVEQAGSSVLGRPIPALTVRRGGADRPVAFILANIHGVEVVTSELALRLLQDLSKVRTPNAVRLLDVADVVVLPVASPDGRAAAFASLERGPIASAPRRNANGVDLNRNWPFPEGAKDHWLPLSGTGLPWLPWYRGTHPLSEPETQAIEKLVRRVRPFAVLNLHSTGQIVTYPWGSKAEPPADVDGFRAMIDAFRAAQRFWTYRSKQSRAWYPILGSSNDHFYDRHGALPLTIEIAKPGAGVRRRMSNAGRFFWYANPTDPDRHIENDAEACFAALIAGFEYRFGSR